VSEWGLYTVFFADDVRLYTPQHPRKNTASLVHYLYRWCEHIVGGKDKPTNVTGMTHRYIVPL